MCLWGTIFIMAIFPPILANVVCYLICLCTLEDYYANQNYMDPDQTAPLCINPIRSIGLINK